MYLLQWFLVLACPAVLAPPVSVLALLAWIFLSLRFSAHIRAPLFLTLRLLRLRGLCSLLTFSSLMGLDEGFCSCKRYSLVSRFSVAKLAMVEAALRMLRFARIISRYSALRTVVLEWTFPKLTWSGTADGLTSLDVEIPLLVSLLTPEVAVEPVRFGNKGDAPED